MCQIITLYILNLHNVICQWYLRKTEREMIDNLIENLEEPWIDNF